MASSTNADLTDSRGSSEHSVVRPVAMRGGNRRGGGGRRGGRGGRRGSFGRGRGRGGPDGRGRMGPRGFRQNRPPHQEPVGLQIEELGSRSEGSLCIAVQGCCHGRLDEIYHEIKAHETRTGQHVDLLLCCGDFQSLRNVADFHSLAVPQKYQELGSFCRYYSGECEAPVLTVFIGGNHEASQPLQELYYGGWVAPNIYYMGAAGVINVGGVRIGGISGIYKSHDYTKGRFEHPPYDRSTLRSVYHVRNVDVYRLGCLSPDRRLDIMLSHDWPQGIEQHGDTAALLRRKPFFRDEVQRNQLGTPPNRELLEKLKPKWWFSAHLHVRFEATIQHGLSSLVPSQVKSTQRNASYQNNESACSQEEANLVDASNAAHNSYQDSESPHNQKEAKRPDASHATHFRALESSHPCGAEPDLTEQMTRFLALDKCLPRRQHLSILHVPRVDGGQTPVLCYDLEWLALLKKTHGLTEPHDRRISVPKQFERATTQEIEWVRKRLLERQGDQHDNFHVPQNFCRTVPAYTDPCYRQSPTPLEMMGNPQTDQFLELLELEHAITVPFTGTLRAKGMDGLSVHDDNEIELCSDTDEALGGQADVVEIGDENEIVLDDNDDNPETPLDLNKLPQHNSALQDQSVATTGLVKDGGTYTADEVADENEISLDDGGSKMSVVKRARVDPD